MMMDNIHKGILSSTCIFSQTVCIPEPPTYLRRHYLGQDIVWVSLKNVIFYLDIPLMVYSTMLPLMILFFHLLLYFLISDL